MQTNLCDTASFIAQTSITRLYRRREVSSSCAIWYLCANRQSSDPEHRRRAEPVQKKETDISGLCFDNIKISNNQYEEKPLLDSLSLVHALSGR